MQCPLCGAECLGIDGKLEVCPECLLVLCDLRKMYPRPPRIRVRRQLPPDKRELH